MNIPADLDERWCALIGQHSGAPGRVETGRAVLADWAQPHRRYHDLDHLRAVLAGVDDLAGDADDPDAVRLAAWYHDVVYRGTPDDERLSAERAEADLAALFVAPTLIAEVSRLVRLTAGHDPAPGDRNGAVLCDADLAVLARPAPDYARYRAAVRAEYAHVDDDAFRAGRARVLRALLADPGVYRTGYGRRHWEDRARVNLTAELTGG